MPLKLHRRTPDIAEPCSLDIVGILSRLLVELEANPYEPSLTAESPYLKYLTCLAEHAPEVSKDFKRSIANPKKWKALAKKLAKESPINRAFLATTQVGFSCYGNVSSLVFG